MTTMTGPSRDAGAAEHLSRARRMLVLAICSMSLLIVGLDTTIVNVALPAIHRSLHASISGLQWTIDAYTLVLASLLMLAGSTADRVGRRRTFQTGLVVFSLASLLCALAPSLDAADRRPRPAGDRRRDAQPGRDVDRPQRVRGPARARAGDRRVGRRVRDQHGARTGRRRRARRCLGWRAVFLVNLPIGLLAIVLTALFVPESRAPHARRFDPVGQVLVIGRARVADLRDHRGAASRGGSRAEIIGLFVVSTVMLRRAGRLRAAPPRAAARDPLLPQRAVLGRERDRGLPVRGDRRVPVPEHPLPAGRPRPLAVARRPVHAADGGDDGRVRADLGPARRPLRLAAVARRRRRSR